MAYLVGMDLEKPWRVTIKPFKKKRSLDQSALYWVSIVKPLCDHTGYSSEEMHDQLRRMFLPLVVYEDMSGENRETLTSTTSLNTVDMSDFMERCRVFAIQDLGVVCG